MIKSNKMNENDTWGRFKVPQKAERIDEKIIYRHCGKISERSIVNEMTNETNENDM